MTAALTSLKGVTQVRVHFDIKEADVDYRPDETSPEKIISGLEQASDGRYRATVKPKP